MVYKNSQQLQKALQKKVSSAMRQTQTKVYRVIQKYINKYYKEKVFVKQNKKSNIPSAYERTEQFLNSLIKTEISINGNRLSCSVKINPEELNYNQSGDIVLDMMNRGFHAEKALFEKRVYETPHDITGKVHFWDDAMEELGGYEGILKIYIENLKKVGIPMR